MAEQPQQFIAPPAEGADIHFDFTSPAPVFGVDLVQKFTGVDLAFVLEPLYRPGERATTQNGQVYYPLRLPVGEGHDVHLTGALSLGFKNVRGYLAIYMPASFQSAWESRVGEEYRGDAKPVPGTDRVGYILTLPPGMIASIKIPMIGFIGLRMGRAPTIAPKRTA